MATGRIVQVIGTVVDIEFPADELPNLFDAWRWTQRRAAGAGSAAAHRQQLGAAWPSAQPTGWPGRNCNDTGQRVSVPVGPETLGRLFDVTGTP